MEREPAVAGRFYPADPEELSGEVAALLEGRPARRHAASAPSVPALGILSPHAGYVYSGAVAGATWARAEIPDRVVLLCPNHTGAGERIAAWPAGDWVTPLGRVPVDEAMTREIVDAGLATYDRAAHRFEHALEVQLPFLQARRPDAAIAALCLGHLSFPRCRELGEGLARIAARHRALVVASSDMSHYVPAAVAREKDRLALDRLLALDARGLHEVVSREDISMCGFVPATVMTVAAVQRGATRAELVRYATSGDVTGDEGSVVGYAGVVLS
jgi:hypothetical protein